MISEIERMLWFAKFLEAGLRAAGPNVTFADKMKLQRWAKSMALIADQMFDEEESA